MKLNIEKASKAEILRILYNNAIPLGLGQLQYTNKDMTIEEAEKLIEEKSYFDYLHGRVMKVRLNKDILRTDLYNRDNPLLAEGLLKDVDGVFEMEPPYETHTNDDEVEYYSLNTEHGFMCSFDKNFNGVWFVNEIGEEEINTPHISEEAIDDILCEAGIY